MTRIALIFTVLVSLAFAGAAQAHYGNLWFTTASNAESMIVDKYDNVYDARCSRRPGAHFYRTRWGGIEYDHFVCAIGTMQERVCSVVAHITGATRYSIVLTGHRYRGCTSRDLWG